MLLHRRGATVALVAVMGLLASACHSNNWYSFRGYNDGRANNADTNNLTIAQASKLTQVGEAPIGSLPNNGVYASTQSGPIEVDGTLFVNGNDGYLHAFLETNGPNNDPYLFNIWNAPTSATLSIDNPPASSAYANVGRLILAPSAQNNVVYAYTTGGEFAWSTNLGALGGMINLSSSAIDDSTQGVIDISAGDYVFSLNPNNGAVLYQSAKYNDITTPVIGGWVPVSGGGNFLWFGTYGGHVRGLNDVTLAEVWDFADASGKPIGAITHDWGGAQVVAAVSGDNLIGLNDTTGHQNWKGTNGTVTPNCGCGTMELTAAPGVVYMVTLDGRIRSFNSNSGAQMLQTNTEPASSSITMANGVIYGTDPVISFNAGNLTQLDKPALSFTAAPFAEAVPADGAVWIVGTDGFLHELT
jgi:hypothetical protein